MKQILSLMTVLALAVMLLPGARANGVETGFDDIAGLPCETAVEVLYEAGIVAVITAHTFDPEATLTRAQMATILVRAYGQETAGEEKPLKMCRRAIGLTTTSPPLLPWA